MSTLETLQDILIEEFDLTRDKIEAGTDLSALGIDSLDLLELMFKIEDRFKLSIRDDAPTSLTTVQDVVVYIDGLLSRRQNGSGTDAADVYAAP
ncbi:MAG: acyl carrier protein [Pseudomonadota bacterium]|nr:acyl carrier protein [Pseudomonadota bacterium]